MLTPASSSLSLLLHSALAPDFFTTADPALGPIAGAPGRECHPRDAVVQFSAEKVAQRRPGHTVGLLGEFHAAYRQQQDSVELDAATDASRRLPGVAEGFFGELDHFA